MFSSRYFGLIFICCTIFNTLATISLASVDVRYVASFLYTSGDQPFPDLNCDNLYNGTISVPYQRDPSYGHTDFVSQPRYYTDVGFFDTFWWFFQKATIDPEDNLFIELVYNGRAAGKQWANSGKTSIIKKGDCVYDDTASPDIVFKFCYEGLN
jgi:hypothetical protein